jgi:hypothetical protein
MFGISAPILFSAVTSALWLGTLLWSIKHREHGWYHFWVLVIATLAWWLGECVAIRLGKYEYVGFPDWMAFPFGGPPNKAERLAGALVRLDKFIHLPGVEGCMPPQESWNIPFSVVALEATLVFAFLRLSYFRLHSSGVRGAVAAAGLSSALIVILAAILDPVVSTTQWCADPRTDPKLHGLLQVNLWHWFTNEPYTGYWFGVPVVNYVAWFVGMGTFSFLTRLDDDGPKGIVKKYDHWFKYVLAAIATLAILFSIEFPFLIGLDIALVKGRAVLLPFVTQRTWEYVFVVALVLLSVFVIVRFGKAHPNPKTEWVAIAPQIIVLVFCLLAIARERHYVLLTVLAFAVISVAFVMALPFIAKKWNARRHGPTVRDGSTPLYG